MNRAALLLLAAVACGSPKQQADTTASLVPDTVKPSPATVQAPVEKTTAAGTKASTTNKGTKGVLGRDSVIRFPLKTLGRPDTTKKPLSSTDSAKVIGRDSVIRLPLKTLGRPDSTKRQPR